jgi:hypothetical protein
MKRVLIGGAIVIAFAVVFVVGIALGEATHDNPTPGGTQTLVRTLQPLPLAPAALETETLTVTVSNH